MKAYENKLYDNWISHSVPVITVALKKNVLKLVPLEDEIGNDHFTFIFIIIYSSDVNKLRKVP